MDTNIFLETIYTELKSLGLVGNQCDFSVMCGRTPAWFSTLKARRLPMTSDAALTLSHNIRLQATTKVDGDRYDHVIALSEAVIRHAQQRIASRQHLRQAEQTA
jgi:hypothetical protein